MATLIFELRGEGDGGSTDTQAGQELLLEWEVTSDTAGVPASEVIEGLAVYVGIFKGVQHPTYAYALCTRVAANRMHRDDPFHWIVTATFKEPRPAPGAEIAPGSSGGGSPGASGGGPQPTPPDRDPWVTGSFRRDEYYRTLDKNGNEIVNSVGHRLQNVPPDYEVIGILTVTVYKDTISYTALKAMENHYNDDDWQGFLFASLLVVGVSWAPHTEDAWAGWKVVYTIEEREMTPEMEEAETETGGTGATAADTGGWYVVPVLDEGVAFLNGSGKLQIKTDDYGQPLGNQPVLLDGAGGISAGVAHFLPYYIKDEVSFLSIGPA